MGEVLFKARRVWLGLRPEARLNAILCSSMVIILVLAAVGIL